jgi:pilus assembly protein CpaB
LKPSLLIGISLILGAIAAFFVAHLSRSPEIAGGPQVVIASSTIQAGTELSTSQLSVLNWPSPSTPQGVFSDTKPLAHRYARQTIEPGELILESKLAAIDSKGGLASIITAGKRAISVRVNDVVGVAGFALPGNYVDILVSAKDSEGNSFSKIVLNRVKVLAVAQDTTSDAAKPKVVNAVTLELTPAESEQLDLARSIGSLSLVLRNEIDAGLSSSNGTRLVDLTHQGIAIESNPLPASNLSNTNNAQDATNTVSTKPKAPKLKGTSSAAKADAVQEIRGIKEGGGAK